MPAMAHDPAATPCRCRSCASRRAGATRRERAAGRLRAAAVLREAAEQRQREADAARLPAASGRPWRTAEGATVALGDMEDRHLFYAARLLLRRLNEPHGFASAHVQRQRAELLEDMRVVLRTRGVRPPEHQHDRLGVAAAPALADEVAPRGNSFTVLAYGARVTPADTRAVHPAPRPALAPLQRPGRRELTLPPDPEPEW